MTRQLLLGAAPSAGRAGRRVVQLAGGLVLFGVSIALLVRAGLGLPSWDVLHQGVARSTGLPFGWVVNAVGALVLLAWIPLRERPGPGTVANVVVVGLAADAALGILPEPAAGDWTARVALLVLGIGGNALATGLYIGAGLGPGPRDGLMTGLARRGWSIRLVRTVLEVAVTGAGWLLGGTVGVGTVLFALAIGPLVQVALRAFSLVPPSLKEEAS